MAYGKAGRYGPEALLSKVSTGLVQDSLLPVNVYLPGTTTLASLWTSAAKTTAAANPVSTDGNGNLAFYADPGYYDLNFTPVGGSVTTISNILVPVDPTDGTPGPFGNATYQPLSNPTQDAPALGLYFPEAHGAKGDGATDDTTAIQAALNAAGTGSVVLQTASYKVTSLTVPSGVVLRGCFSRTYSGAASGSSRLINTATAQTAPIVTLNSRAIIESVSITGPGAGTNCPGIRLQGTNRVSSCHVRTCSIGIDANYTGVHIIDSCDIAENGGGINSPIDSFVSKCWVNANTSYGIYLGTGANDNSILQNKVEFNATGVTGSNILMYQANNNNIVGNVIDRSGGSGIRINACVNVNVVANMLRRNGQSNPGDLTENCHIRLTGSTGCSVVGNTTAHGPDDGGTGYDSPYNALYVQGNTDCRVADNALKGCTSSSFNDGGGHTNFSRFHNATTDFEVGIGRVALSSSGGGQAAATNGTVTFTFSALASASTYTVGSVYHFDVVARDTGTGGRSVARIDMLISREAGNASVSLGIRNLFGGAAFAASAGNYNVTATTAVDGTTITVTITNTTANPVQFSGTGY